MAKTEDGMLSYSTTPISERTDMSSSERELWRSVVRVESMGKDTGLISLILPTWNQSVRLDFPWEDFPVDLMGRFSSAKEGEQYRFHAYTNFGADKRKPSDIYIDLNKRRYELD